MRSESVRNIQPAELDEIERLIDEYEEGAGTPMHSKSILDSPASEEYRIPVGGA